MGSVDWNGNEVANALDLDLGLNLDLTSAATFAARAAERFWPEGPDQLSCKLVASS